MPLLIPSEIIRDWALYPREQVDPDHVYVLKEALRAGVELPPIVVEKPTKRLIDGFHRLDAWEQVHGNSVAIPVAFKTCKTKQDFLLESIKANASHGRPLTHLDRSRCLVLAENMDVPPEAVATALNLTVDKAIRLTQDALKPPSHKQAVPKPSRRPSSMAKSHQKAYDFSEDDKGVPHKTKLAFYAGQLRVALMNKVIPASLHEQLLLLHREMSEFFAESHVDTPRLRAYFLAQGHAREDIDAALELFERRQTLGGEPIKDNGAWVGKVIQQFAAAHAQRHSHPEDRTALVQCDDETVRMVWTGSSWDDEAQEAVG